MKHELKDIKGYEGLKGCLNCGSAEGELSTDCPNYRIPSKVKEAIFGGHLDYVRDQWVGKMPMVTLKEHLAELIT